MLINPFPYSGGEPGAPLNSKPWSNIKNGRELLLLNDADQMVYLAGFSIEHEEITVFAEHGDILFRCDGRAKYNAWLKSQPLELREIHQENTDRYNWTEPYDKADLIISARMKAIKAASRCHKMNTYLTKGSTLWRNGDAHIQEYKGNRKAARKPAAYDYIRDLLKSRYHAKILAGLEADDGVAAMARERPGEVIICSPDKDLRTIPGLQINPQNPYLKDGVVFVSELQACRNLYIQMLTGDKVDNIKGLSGDKRKPGWGPVKARAAIEQFVCELDMVEFVEKEYRNAYPDGVIGYNGEHIPWWKMLEETANLLFLRRYHDTRFKWEA